MITYDPFFKGNCFIAMLQEHVESFSQTQRCYQQNPVAPKGSFRET